MLTSARIFIVRIKSLSACKLHTYITYWLTQMSSIVLMMVSLDRLIVITKRPLVSFLLNKCFPAFCFHKTKSIEKKIAFVGALLLLVNAHFLIFLELNSFESYFKLSNVSNETLKMEPNNLTASQSKNNWRNKHSSSEIREINSSLSENFKEHPSNESWSDLSFFQMCYPTEDSNYYFFLGNFFLSFEFLYSPIKKN